MLRLEIIDSINWTSPNGSLSIVPNFNIGSYLLINNDSNQYKCGFKALEYLAMGIPVASSFVAENMIIIQNEEKCYLVKNEDIKRGIGKAGRNKIKSIIH